MHDQEGRRPRNEAHSITSSMKRPSFLVFGLTPYPNTMQCMHDQLIKSNGMQTQCNVCKHNAMQQACKHNGHGKGYVMQHSMDQTNLKQASCMPRQWPKHAENEVQKHIQAYMPIGSRIKALRCDSQEHLKSEKHGSVTTL